MFRVRVVLVELRVLFVYRIVKHIIIFKFSKHLGEFSCLSHQFKKTNIYSEDLIEYFGHVKKQTTVEIFKHYLWLLENCWFLIQ